MENRDPTQKKVLGFNKKEKVDQITETKETIMLDNLINGLQDKKEEYLENINEVDYYYNYKHLEMQSFLNKTILECNQ